MRRTEYLFAATLLCFAVNNCDKGEDTEQTEENSTENVVEESESEESAEEEATPEVGRIYPRPEVDLESLSALHCCDTIDTDSECTEFTAEGIAVLSAESRAGLCENLAGGTFSEGSCPTVGHVGTCMIRTPLGPPGNGTVGQIVHHYDHGGTPHTTDSAWEQSNCMTGMFVPYP